jgi:fused signal recognition particle receptor
VRGLIKGLNKTKERLKGSLQNIISSKSLSADVVEEIEAVLLSADLGVDATDRILERLGEQVGRGGKDAAESLRIIAGELLAIIDEIPATQRPQGHPRVIIVIGVNGVGKTSTIGKLAHRFKSGGNTVLLAACDTFRAAAIDQLELWADRAGVPVVKQVMGADPAAVAFDAVQSAVSRDIDVVIIDTAGRLHTKKNLMDELGKIFRVLSKRMEHAALEAWLVLDANTGQNSLRQAEAFVESLPVTGLVLTKLDSTAKGGVVIPIQMQLGIPVLFVGVGEGIDDLEPFDHRLFVEALVGEKAKQ